MSRPWTEEERIFVKDNYNTMSCREIGSKLNRSESAVSVFAIKNKLNIRTGIRPSYGLKEDEPKYGKLKIIRKYVINKITKVECECDCGNKCVKSYSKLTIGRDTHCGCSVNYRKTHGLYKHRLFWIFQKMKNRCYNKKQKGYHNYGGRGIVICEEWLNNLQSFYDWAMTNGYEDNLTIDRKDNNGNYEPNNCRWLTKAEQNINKRTNKFLEIFNERKTVSEWVKDIRCKVNNGTLRSRLRVGWEPEKALTTPTKFK